MSTTNLTAPIEKAAHVLVDAKDQIKVLLLEDHPSLLLTVTSQLDLLINRLGHLSGIAIVHTKAEEFKPVTNFMGEDITRPREVTSEDLSALPEDVAILVAKVDRLYAEFDTIAPEGILNAYTIPEEQLVLRGVAKRAGVEDYEDAEINVYFIEKIAKAIKQKVADELEAQRIDADFAKQAQITELTMRLQEASIKGEQLDADLKEAEAEEAAATNAKAKEKAAKKVAGILEEIEAAKVLHTQLTEQLTALQGQ